MAKDRSMAIKHAKAKKCAIEELRTREQEAMVCDNRFVDRKILVNVEPGGVCEYISPKIPKKPKMGDGDETDMRIISSLYHCDETIVRFYAQQLTAHKISYTEFMCIMRCMRDTM